jgi:hypothetical protein
MPKTVAQFYTPKAAADVCGLTPERIAKLCEKMDCPVVVYSIPTRENTVGSGGYLVPAEMLQRFSDMLDEMDGEMLVRLSGDEDRRAE